MTEKEILMTKQQEQNAQMQQAKAPALEDALRERFRSFLAHSENLYENRTKPHKDSISQRMDFVKVFKMKKA